jgi:hypothetical protein
MHTETYSSPIIKPAGAIVDLTAAAHIDHYSPEPGTTVMPGAIFSRSPEPTTTIVQQAPMRLRSPEPTTTFPPAPMRLNSPEPMATKPAAIDFTYVRPSVKAAGRVTDMTSAANLDKRSPEPLESHMGSGS